MDTATNVDATAVNTIRWLSALSTTIVVPVYQRQYRWDIDGCEQLLADIRSVADAPDGQMHFIGSILSSHSTEATSAEADAHQLVLIDGQQRITTLMLLIAALQHTVIADNPVLAAQLDDVLVRGSDPVHTTLRPHRAWAELFESVVLGQRSGDTELRDSRFDDNYAFFRSQITPDEAPRVWRGLQRLEHVAITLKPGANAQQIFESLNSTGAPLRDHELIHNYVLMGLSHSEQVEIEDSYWLPLEQNTSEAIGSFWRHYLIMRTGIEVDASGERGVYDAFHQQFPVLDRASLRAHAAEWRDLSAIYRILMEPSREQDSDIARQLSYINTFGRGMYPLVLRAYSEYAAGALTKHALILTLEYVQTLQLRRTVVGLGNDRLVARLCRAWNVGQLSLEAAIARVMPSNERVRVALKYGALPHPAYVLGRLAALDDADAFDARAFDAQPFDVEHIVPLTPGDSWSGDGVRAWAEYGEDEQNSHRALAPSLGNLTLLEPDLAERALELSFPQKRATVYSQSTIAMNNELARVERWGTAAIAERTVRLTAEFLRLWAGPDVAAIDDDGLTPILDAQRRRGWPAGWQREFEYVEYQGEHWDVFDVKYLFNRIFKRLWADSRHSVEAFSARRGGPIFDSQAWNGHWDALDETHFLYMGWDSKYMLTAVQGVLDEAGIAPEVFVKYSYIGDAM